jgi:hypothetical protein
MPQLSSTDRVLIAARDMTDALKHPHPDFPFAAIVDETIIALTTLATIFKTSRTGLRINHNFSNDMFITFYLLSSQMKFIILMCMILSNNPIYRIGSLIDYPKVDWRDVRCKVNDIGLNLTLCRLLSSFRKHIILERMKEKVKSV